MVMGRTIYRYLAIGEKKMKNDVDYLKIAYYCMVCMLLAIFVLILFNTIYLSSPLIGLYDEAAIIIIFIIKIFIAIFSFLTILFMAITVYNF